MTFERSRCCVMRCNTSSCRRCVNACPHEAIGVAPVFAFSSERCTGCLRCVAVCPSEALTASRMEQGRLCDLLSQLPNPVIGCATRPESQGHVKVPCFGGFDEEWLLVLLLSLPDTVQINLTACAACQNGDIVADLKHSVENIAAHTGIAAFRKIRLIEHRSELVYKEFQFDRRRFFRAFGTKVIRDIQHGVPSQPLRYGNAAYHQKTVPVKRQRLNQFVRNAADDLRQNILTRYYYTVECSETCTACFACTAVCPTGALERLPEEERLRFEPARCTGCAVCAEFCRQQAIQVNTGWFRDTLQPITI